VFHLRSSSEKSSFLVPLRRVSVWGPKESCLKVLCELGACGLHLFVATVAIDARCPNRRYIREEVRLVNVTMTRRSPKVSTWFWSPPVRNRSSRWLRFRLPSIKMNFQALRLHLGTYAARWLPQHLAACVFPPVVSQGCWCSKENDNYSVTDPTQGGTVPRNGVRRERGGHCIRGDRPQPSDFATDFADTVVYGGGDLGGASF